mmetsp:Transcript_36210/g.59526  ORF Transcript_36210/g.59526 Transcript_36210/m.59526 type:complete len:350 (-) Transcript_36210:271-1320(-)
MKLIAPYILYLALAGPFLFSCSLSFCMRPNQLGIRASNYPGTRTSTSVIRSMAEQPEPSGPNTDQPSPTKYLVEPFREVVMGRRSVRKFLPNPIPDETMDHIIDLTQRAPSGFNVQPYVIVLVKSEETKRALADAMLGASNKRRVLEAPVTAVFASDLENLRHVRRVEGLLRAQGLPKAAVALARPGLTIFSGGHRALLRLPSLIVRKLAFRPVSLITASPKVSTPETWAVKNTMLAVQNYMLASVAYGLNTAPMEGYDARRVRRALKLPRRFTVPLVVATGYPGDLDEEAAPSARWPRDRVVFSDRFDRREYKRWGRRPYEAEEEKKGGNEEHSGAEAAKEGGSGQQE